MQILVKLTGGMVDGKFLDSTVFRYVWQSLEPYLEGHGGDVEVARAVRLLRLESEEERASGRVDFVPIPDEPEPIAAVVRAVQSKLQEGRRTPGVQALVGAVLDDAFSTQQLRPQVYGDVRPALHRWRDRGHAVGIYDELPASTQEAWLRHNVGIDLSSLVARCFHVDEKAAREPSTYRRMVADLAAEGPTLLATERTFEALAASHAGLEAVVLERHGVYGEAPHGLRVETNLLALDGR